MEMLKKKKEEKSELVLSRMCGVNLLKCRPISTNLYRFGRNWTFLPVFMMNAVQNMRPCFQMSRRHSLSMMKRKQKPVFAYSGVILPFFRVSSFSPLFPKRGENRSFLGRLHFFRPLACAGGCTKKKKKTGFNPKNDEDFKNTITFGIGHGQGPV